MGRNVLYHFYDRFASAAMSVNVKSVRKTLLSEHNRVRAIHGSDSLKSSSELEAQAQKWAEQLASMNRLQHSNNSYKSSPLGENVFGGFHSGKTPEDIAIGATESWYSEIDDFDFNKPEAKLKGCGHFTQVIWKASQKVGFGIAKSSDGHVYVVGQYYPAGNFVNHVAENVTRPKNGKKAEFKESKKTSSSSKKTDDGKEKPVRQETKTEVKEEVIGGKRVKKTIITTTDHFADGSTRTTTRTQTETFG